MTLRIALGRPDPLDPAKQHDGIDTYASQLAGGLRARGGVEVVECWYPGRVLAQQRAAFPVPFAPSTAAAQLLGQTPGAASIGRIADVFHSTDYRIPRFRRLPVVATLHDAIAVAHRDWARRGTWLRAHMAGVVAGWAQRVVCVSNTAATEVIAAFGLREGIVRVIYPGVHERFFAAGDGSSRAPTSGHSEAAHQPYFLFVGKFQPRKNLERVLAAHRALPVRLRREHPLLVVGQHGWGCEEACRQLADHCAHGFATWLQNVPHDQMPQVYRRALALVFPSLHEGFGLPLLEAFAAGTPVIASTAGALPEIAGGSALFVEPLSVGEIAAAMEYVARGGADISARVAAGERRAREFTWDRTAAQTLQLYRELA